MSLTQDLIAEVQEKDNGQPEFHQAVREVLTSIEPTLSKHPEFVKAKIYQRIVVPDRAILFRVPWLDHRGEVQVNRGFRVQFNNALGPYKGGRCGRVRIGNVAEQHAPLLVARRS